MNFKSSVLLLSLRREKYAWYNKGNVLIKIGRYEDAIKSYEEATRIKPDYANAWNNKGTALDLAIITGLSVFRSM
jgi:tetratricopeptide (TPR) repeat protein